MNQLGSIDPYDSEIRFGILANQIGVNRPTVRSRDLQLTCAVNDVAVGENITIRGDHKSRPRAAGIGSSLRAVGVMDANIYHGWSNLIDNVGNSARVGIEQFAIVFHRRFDGRLPFNEIASTESG